MSEHNASIVIYSSPFCAYCAAAKRLLATKNASYEEIDIIADPSRRSEMVERSGRTTVPQIFVGTTHVGGFDDLNALAQANKLDSLLAGDTD